MQIILSLISSSTRLGFWLGIVLFFVIENLGIFPDATITHMAAVAALMVTWWISESLPLAVTALVPLVAFPLLGITSGKDVADVYINSTIFLFIGGFVLALAMQRWGLHKRIALRVIGWFNGSARMMVMGFMLTSAGLSMWISNTATATMLLPIGMAVYARCADVLGEKERQQILTALMLGIAYSCSIGGTATLIGTPPNMAMQRIFSITFPDAPVISFAQWLLFALPLVVSMLLLCWYVITRRYTGKSFSSLDELSTDLSTTRTPMSYEEKVVTAVFSLTALCWIFRNDIALGEFVIPGWSGLFAHANYFDDGTVAMTSALLLFSLSSKDKSRYQKIVDIDTIAEIPWRIVLLFGGGFALAKGFSDSGLAEFTGRQFIDLKDFDTLSLIAGTTSIVVFLTEVTSNTATAQMLLPLVATVAQSIEVNPLLLMIPVTLAASMAFMMPVATPPNAIVFASGQLRIRDMATTGLIINLLAIVLITLFTWLWGMLLFDIQLQVMPDWAK